MFNELKKYTTKPKLYDLSINKFWDDEHISKGLLATYLFYSMANRIKMGGI